MKVAYRHTQIGYLMIGGFAAGMVGIAASFSLPGAPTALAVPLGILALCLLLFPTLTAVVESDRLRCFFGLGLIRREILLTEILTASVVRNSWTSGWGLRLIPGGWLWNVSGLDAVELQLKNGRVFRIGTDDPIALQAAITRAMGGD